MSLQNFVDRAGPVISAAWLNAVDALKYAIFNDAATPSEARAALTRDFPLEVNCGGTGVRTLEELRNIIHPGVDSITGYLTLDGPDTWNRAADLTTWTPSGATRKVEAKFTQGGVDVGRMAWLVTRDASGILTGASTAHSEGDLNPERITITELSEGTQVFAVDFYYTDGTLATRLTQTISTNMASGGAGSQGPGAITMTLNKPFLPVFSYQDGTVVDMSGAFGQATIWEGPNDVTASATFNAVTVTNCTGTINTATNNPVASQPKGYYKVNTLTQNTGLMLISATYNGTTVTAYVSLAKQFVGVEIVATLPTTNLFIGRLVYLTTDGKLWRNKTGLVGGWSVEVDGADLKANSVTTNAILAGAITAAKITVTALSALTSNIGTMIAGILQSASGGFRIDLDNARIIINTAPGTTGGYVCIKGYGFGPSNNYMEWYGPKPAGQSTDAGIIANLSDATALYYMKTDGNWMAAGRIRGEFEPKAWCTFDGSTGNVATVKDRFNVASVTRSATGTYSVVFATALANPNYAVATNGQIDAAGDNPVVVAVYNKTTNGFTCKATNFSWNARDSEVVSFVVFGSNIIGGNNVSTPGGGFGGGTRGGGNIP